MKLCVDCNTNLATLKSTLCYSCKQKRSQESIKNSKTKKAFEQKIKDELSTIKKQMRLCSLCRCPLSSRQKLYCKECSEKIKRMRPITNCRDILESHHNALKDDPERLSSKFIKSLVGCSCEVSK